MKVLWCWRCRQEMPMLNEGEYTEASRLYGECMKNTKEFHQKWGLPLDTPVMMNGFDQFGSGMRH
jgi:hypothetical protein